MAWLQQLNVFTGIFEDQDSALRVSYNKTHGMALMVLQQER
jgi:hypothetical protein